MAKTAVVDPVGPPGAPQAGQARADARVDALMHLFEDEDAPTLAYKGDEPAPAANAEASVLLVPDPSIGARSAPASAPVGPPPWADTGQPGQAASPKRKSKGLLVVVIVLVVVVVLSGLAVGASLIFYSRATDEQVVARQSAGASSATTTVEPDTELATPTVATPVQPVPVPITPSGVESTTAPVPVPTDQPQDRSDTPEVETRTAETTGAEAASADAARDQERELGLRQDPPPVTGAVAASPTQPVVVGTRPESEPGQGGELATALAPLTGRVLQCTRRESGYNPRALTVHLVPDGSDGARLRSISPPTPPRVVQCIARALQGVSWSAPEGERTASYTFRLDGGR